MQQQKIKKIANEIFVAVTPTTPENVDEPIPIRHTLVLQFDPKCDGFEELKTLIAGEEGFKEFARPKGGGPKILIVEIPIIMNPDAKISPIKFETNLRRIVEHQSFNNFKFKVKPGKR